MRHVWKIILVSLSLFILGACALNDTEETVPTLSDVHLTFQILNVQEGEQTLFAELPSDQMWLDVSLAIENVGDAPRTIQSVLMFMLEDEEGRYDIDIFNSQIGAIDGRLEPGEREEGLLSFAVPKGDQWRLIITPNINQPGQLIFDITLDS